MKFAVSFVRAPGQSAPWLAMGLTATGVLLIATALGFALRGWVLRSEQPQLEARLERAKKTADEIAETPLPARPELDALRLRVAAINQITGTGGDALTDVLLRLEANLPDDVALISLRYQRRQREILAVAETSRAEMLTETLQRLERNAVFREVRLARQSERSGGRGGVQFELRLKD